MMNKRAFTLIEILITVGIICTLGAILIPISNASFEKARSVKEIAGAKAAITAWRTYSNENNGAVLTGYLSMAQASRIEVRNVQGNLVPFPSSARYPFRLAPYLDYKLKGTLLLDKQATLVDDYPISMGPSLGLNLTFVGGDFGSQSDKQPTDANIAAFGKFVVTNVNEIHSPSRLLVFASSRFTDAAHDPIEGYNAIKSPYLTGSRWKETYTDSSNYYDFGSIHPRYNKRAVCAMADGHVELLSIDDLRDMRRWSNQAAQADDPNWTLQPL